jgi:hypothetical protein
MKMVSLKISKTEMKLREPMAVPSEVPSGPRYPYGLCIHLDKDVLNKLGLDVSNFDAGQRVEFRAEGKVESISKRDTMDSGREQSMSIQITDMAWGAFSDEVD